MIDIVCPKCFSDFVMWRVLRHPTSYCVTCGHEWDGLKQLRQQIKQQKEKRHERIQKSIDERP